MKKLIIPFLLALSPTVLANSVTQTVDLRDHHLKAEVKSILAPNLLEMQTTVDGYDVVFWVEPAFVAWGDVRWLECKDHEEGWLSGLWSPSKPPTQQDRHLQRLAKGCEAVEYLKGKDVELEVVNWTGSPYPSNTVYRANIFYKNESVGYRLVSQGVYPVDATQTRDTGIVNVQKDPDCLQYATAKGLEKFERSNLTCMRFAR